VSCWLYLNLIHTFDYSKYSCKFISLMLHLRSCISTMCYPIWRTSLRLCLYQILALRLQLCLERYLVCGTLLRFIYSIRFLNMSYLNYNISFFISALESFIFSSLRSMGGGKQCWYSRVCGDRMVHYGRL